MWQIERARARLKCGAGPEGAGWTDEAVADARDGSAGRVGRGRRQAVAEGPEAGRERQAKVPRSRRRDRAGQAHRLQWVQSPARRVGPCGHWPANGRYGGLCPASATRRCVARSKTN